MNKKNVYLRARPRAVEWGWSLLGAGLMWVSTAARAEVTEQLSYSIYTAPYKAGQSMRQALSSATPIRENGEVFHGYTQWHIRWRFRWQSQADGACRMVANTTELSAVITLPELSGADAQGRREFASYIAALRKHEMGHYQIAQVAAQRIDQAILALPTTPSCQALSIRANELGERFLAQARQAGFDYDRDTQHGRTQGAWLPP